jgi:hypothetical protein
VKLEVHASLRVSRNENDRKKGTEERLRLISQNRISKQSEMTGV